MKKLAFLVFMLLGGASFLSAAQVEISVKIDDDVPNVPGHSKSPVEPPYVWQEGYTFTFDESCLGCTLRLVDESDTVVYTTVITSDTVVLPSTFSGNYELQVIRGIWCFFGFIEL